MVKVRSYVLIVSVTIFVNAIGIKSSDQGSNNSLEATNESPSTGEWVWMLPQQPLDEFNSTENPLILSKLTNGELWQGQKLIASLKELIMRYSYEECCPKWQNLSTNQAIQEELKKRTTISRSAKIGLQESDILNELKRTFFNITYLSIDGQYGENEREKYYNFYDGVNYYLRLMKVARTRLLELEIANDDDLGKLKTTTTTIDTNGVRALRRFLKTVDFKVSQDPVLSSFLKELLLGSLEKLITKDTPIKWNPKFEFYEDFIRFTNFGQDYARNVSIIRESILVFDQICSHLMSFNFPNNFTRPSKQYEMVRRMSHELYLIRYELIQQVSLRVRNNREDLKRIFSKLEDIIENRPYIRLLGDEFSSNPPYFSSYVSQLTGLLDLYLSNSLTPVSFYDQLAELPEEFIILGSKIAHEYESKETPQYSQFDTGYFNWPSSAHNQIHEKDVKKSHNISKTSEQVDPRQSNLSLLTRLFN